MKILNNIKLIDLAIYTDRTLIFTDFHIGYEEALNKQGLMVPRFQFSEIMKRIENIFSKLKNKKIDRIIVNGDLKHEFGTISDQEWRHTLKLLDYFGQHCKEIILIRGNHDTILGPIAKKRNIRTVDHYLISPILKKSLKNEKTIKKINIKNRIEKKLKINNKKLINGKNSIGDKNKILVIHGNKIPNKELLKKSKTIIIGHEHPAVSVREGPRAELFKAYLVGKWKNKHLIVQPSFNLVTEGTDVLRNCIAISGTPKIPKEFFSVTKEELLSPFLQQNLGNFDVIIVADKMYRFGKLRGLS